MRSSAVGLPTACHITDMLPVCLVLNSECVYSGLWPASSNSTFAL